jgi:hypothetical protein
MCRNDKSQHRVPEKFESFVVGSIAVFVRIRTVGKCEFEQLRLDVNA